MKGFYVINDHQTRQRHAGSAFGDTWIWQRWTTYANTLHGGNAGLKELVKQNDEERFRTNMRFALLKYWSMQTDDAHLPHERYGWPRGPNENRPRPVFPQVRGGF